MKIYTCGYTVTCYATQWKDTIKELCNRVLFLSYLVRVWKVDCRYFIPLLRLEEGCSCFSWGEASEARASSGSFVTGNLQYFKTQGKPIPRGHRRANLNNVNQSRKHMHRVSIY